MSYCNKAKWNKKEYRVLSIVKHDYKNVARTCKHSYSYVFVFRVFALN